MVASATAEREVLGLIPGLDKKWCWIFSNRNFSVVARSLEVGGMIPPWLEKHVKPLVLLLISLQSCQIAVPSDYESKGTQSTPMPAHSALCFVAESKTFKFYVLLVKGKQN